MNLTEFLETISFKKLTGIAFILAIGLSVPLSVWVAQQETKLEGRAYFEKPEAVTQEKIYGQPSAGEPKINLVWPFLGKAGDAVLIYGENFGDNPKNKDLFLDNLPVTENDLLRWTPNLIEFKIPVSTPSLVFETVSLAVAGKNAFWRYPFTTYDLNTQIQATKENQVLQIISPAVGPVGTKVEVYLDNGEKLESDQLEEMLIPEGKTIVSLTVKDQKGFTLPFFVEPSEFGF